MPRSQFRKWSRGRALAAVSATALLAGGCAAAPPVAVIGLGYLAEQNAAAVLTVVLDSLARAGGPTIRISTGDLSLKDQPNSFTVAEVGHATRLATLPGLVGVVGHGGSRESLMTAPIYNEAHLAQIVPTSTSRRLRAAGPWTFTLAPNDSLEGEFLARFVAERLQARTVTLFYVLDEYGAGLRDGVVGALARRGVRVLDEVPVQSSADCAPTRSPNAYAATVDAALLRGQPDVVVLAARQLESGCIVARVHDRYPATLFVAGDGVIVTDEFRRRAGSGADSVHVVAFWHPDRADSVSQAFVRRYQRLFGAMPTYYDAMIYDALYALSEAVRAVGTDREDIRAWLLALGHGRPPLHGVTGPISFPGTADLLLMTRVRGDRLMVVRTP